MADRTGANRDVALRYLAALAAGDWPALAALHHEDVVFESLGTTPVSGRFVGREACLKEVLPPVVGALVPGSFSFARDAVVAVVDEGGAVVITRSDGDAVRGGRYEQVCFLALSIDHGLITKLDAAYDTAHVSEVVFGDRLGTPRERPESRLPADLGKQPTGGSARAVVERFYAALAAADIRGFMALHAPDVVFDLPGSLPLSGHFAGREACVKGVIEPFLTTFDLTRTTFGRHYRILCADDHRVAALMRGGGRTTSGGVADVIFAQLFTVADGQIVHLHQQLDTAHIEDACYANPLRDSRARTSGGLVV